MSSPSSDVSTKLSINLAVLDSIYDRWKYFSFVSPCRGQQACLAAMHGWAEATGVPSLPRALRLGTELHANKSRSTLHI